MRASVVLIGVAVRILYVNMISEERFGKASYFCGYMITQFVSILESLHYFDFWCDIRLSKAGASVAGRPVSG